MAGLLDKFLDVLHLNSEYEEQEFFDDADDDTEEDEPPKRKAAPPAKSIHSEIVPEPQKPTVKVRTSRQNSKVVPMRGNLSSMEVCVIKPYNLEEAREISDTLLDGKAIILNLEGIDVNVAQRILDFTAGACYAISGNLKMISGYIFIATPEAVDISGDFQELLENMSESHSASNIIAPGF